MRTLSREARVDYLLVAATVGVVAVLFALGSLYVVARQDPQSRCERQNALSGEATFSLVPFGFECTYAGTAAATETTHRDVGTVPLYGGLVLLAGCLVGLRANRRFA